MTNEEIIKFYSWKLDDFNKIHGEQLFGLLEKARHDGREEGAAEQREKDAKVAENYYVMPPNHAIDGYFLPIHFVAGWESACELIEQAIRTQEAEKTGGEG